MLLFYHDSRERLVLWLQKVVLDVLGFHDSRPLMVVSLREGDRWIQIDVKMGIPEHRDLSSCSTLNGLGNALLASLGEAFLD